MSVEILLGNQLPHPVGQGAMHITPPLALTIAHNIQSAGPLTYQLKTQRHSTTTFVVHTLPDLGLGCILLSYILTPVVVAQLGGDKLWLF